LGKVTEVFLSWIASKLGWQAPDKRLLVV